MVRGEGIELWAPCKTYPLYEASNLGRIRRFHRQWKRWNIKGQRADKDGYMSVSIRTPEGKETTARVHRMVADAFIPNPTGNPVVHHKDNVKDNNDVSNLEWTSISNNTAHSYHIGVIRSPLAKYIKATIDGETFSYYSSCAKCSEAFGAGRGVIESCVSEGEKYYGFIELEEVLEIPEGSEEQRILLKDNPPRRGFKPHKIKYLDGSFLKVSGTQDLSSKYEIHRSQATRILNKGAYWENRGIIEVVKISEEEFVRPLINWRKDSVK